MDELKMPEVGEQAPELSRPGDGMSTVRVIRLVRSFDQTPQSPPSIHLLGSRASKSVDSCLFGQFTQTPS